MIAVDYPLKECELCEGDCVEVTTTTGIIQNRVGVKKDGELVAHLTSTLLPRTLSNDLVWELADMFNQLMVIPNVIALIALAPLVVRAAKKTK